METVEEIITAGRLSNVTQITSLSEDYNPGKAFSLLLVPKDGGSVEDGDWMKIQAMLPYPKDQFVEVPVRVGVWQEMVFKALKASDIDLTDVDVWVSLMNNYKM